MQQKSRTPDLDMSNLLDALKHRVEQHLDFIYPDQNNSRLADSLITAMGLHAECHTPRMHENNWNESDSVLITYGDSVINGSETPLKALHRFLRKCLGNRVRSVHILPFFPYSSDDGFAVEDYYAVNPDLGTWEDVVNISKDYRLMTDLVVNHTSSKSKWFQNYLAGKGEGHDYFIEASPSEDLSQVVRPRNSPLLAEVATSRGPRHVWCTFSDDQVDMNFRNPDVLLEFVKIIKFYMDNGADIFRLDAVAFLWKEIGTSCIHLQETHEIIKLMRTLIEHKSPGSIIITETNVPNRENLTYFGNNNEAHVIYNFSLPPLLIYTLVSGDCRHLKTWLMSMPPARFGTAYLNFIASHDGVGLRPLDGLVSEEDRDKLVEMVKAFGGQVTYRKAREGYDKPYELNIALYDALKGSLDGVEDSWQMRRFLCAHAIMFALEGIPAMYIHSLIGTENYIDGYKRTGRARTINRRSWKWEELHPLLDDPDSHHHTVFNNMLNMLEIRANQPAFHPNATQYTLHLGTEIFGFWRQSIDRSQSIFCLFNITSSEQQINLTDINLIGTDHWVDLLSNEEYTDLRGQIILAPYQSVWLTNRVPTAGTSDAEVRFDMSKNRPLSEY